jgi:hypothetical protein
MTWVATAIAGGALVGGYAANKAAKTQANAAERGIEAQEDALNRQISLNEPFRQAGLASQNRLMTLLGIRSPTPTSGGGSGGVFGGVEIPDSVRNQITGGSSTNGSEFVTDPNSPDFGKYARDFSMSDFEADPGYAFRLSEGVKALDRSAAARGGLLSGAALKGSQRYGQEMGSQEYQRAYDRYQTNRANQLNPLMGYATGPGMSATSASTAAVGNFGNAAATGYGNIGQARASGYVGAANALNSALGQGLNYYQNQQYINRLPYGGNGQGYNYIEMPR